MAIRRAVDGPLTLASGTCSDSRGPAMSQPPCDPAYASLGEFPRARSLYERAIAIMTPVYGPSHPDVARILSGYAALLLRMGENRLALDAALRTELIGRDHLAAAIRTQPERLAVPYACTRAT